MHTRTTTALALAPLALLLSACGSQSEGRDQAATSATTSSESVTDHAGEREVRALPPRALIAHDGGLSLLDTSTGKLLDTVENSGFLRLNDAGDGQHVMVSDGDTVRVYDTGISERAHGDHAHRYVTEPGLTDTTWPARAAGHVVPHNGFTTLFADGSGAITAIATDQISKPEATTLTASTPQPHHGVALVLDDGSLLTTEGTEESRRRVVVRAQSRDAAQRWATRPTASTDACPGVHGEATAAPDEAGHDVVVLGCEDGPVIWSKGAFAKVPVADAYARTGNLAGHPESPVVLGDYKVDATAELERPTRVSLIDTTAKKLRTLDVGNSYWFRSLARGPHGEGLVLTTDGSIQVIDAEKATVTAQIPVIGAWQEKDDWQEPGPVLKVADHLAYVTDPTANELVVVDLESHTVLARHDIPAGSLELAITTGLEARHTAHH